MDGLSGLADTTVCTLLTPLEAAQYLGITPELLFFYTSRSFQKTSGATRRLETRNFNGSTRFTLAELDAFDQYLHEPWADEGTKRRDPPQKILAYLHAESGGACVRCGSGIGVETAHIESWATSRSNHHHNLLRICSSCHSEHDLHNSLPTEELHRLKVSTINQLREQLKRRMGPRTCGHMPTSDPLFIGRASELATLREALRTERFVLVRGPGGVGKTQLMLQALANTETGRTVLWIDMERYETIDAMRMALELAIRERIGTSTCGDLIDQLDTIHACIVFDGVEQLKGPALDAVDDWISDLQTRVKTTQILVTSQVDLQLTRFEHELNLHGLDENASQHMLEHFIRPGTAIDHHSRDSLLTFADGHPLTLRLTAMLVSFFGSGRVAREQIEQRGVEIIEVQKRALPDRRTSLRVCLSLAYEALNPDEQRLLFLIANAPGGMFSVFVEADQLGIVNARLAIAGALRWSLVRIEARGDQSERLYMLSPIAQFVISRWRNDAPDETVNLTKELARMFAIMAAAIYKQSENPNQIPYMLARLEQELPNLLRVIDFAEKEPGDAELSLFTSGVCSALMSYFFVHRLGDAGSRVMLRGARIAIRDKELKRASDLLTQMVGLATRSEDQTELYRAIDMLNQIGQMEIDAETRGNIALAHAALANIANDLLNTEHHARAAISYFETALTECTKRPYHVLENGAVDDLSGIENDLSAAFGFLGNALLSKGQYSDGATAYRTALSWLRGDSIAVNDGQLHHQIGNCESHLGNHKAAANCYILAAARFHVVGMREYLSNALGELGHTILAFNKREDLSLLPSPEVLDDGLNDVATDIKRGYSKFPLDAQTCMASGRKLFGLIVLISLGGHTGRLGACSTELKSDLSGPEICEEWGDEWGDEAIDCMELLLELMTSIDIFERRTKLYGLNQKEVGELAKVCHSQSLLGGLRQLSFDWLAIYLYRRWGIEAGEGNQLYEAASSAIAGSIFTFPNTRKI